MTALLLLAFASAPSLARAGTINTAPAAPAAVAETPGEPPVSSAPASAAPGETADYAAREAAAPELGNFQGGSVVVFIGGGTLLIVLIILIVLDPLTAVSADPFRLRSGHPSHRESLTGTRGDPNGPATRRAHMCAADK